MQKTTIGIQALNNYIVAKYKIVGIKTANEK